MKTFVFLAALVACSMAMIIPKSGVVQHKMVSAPSARARLIKEGKWAKVYKSLQQRYAVKGSQQGSQPLIDYYDDFYLVNVSTGTPPQYFNVVPDTGSSNYWIIDVNCFNEGYQCNGDPGSGYTKNLFDSSKSTSFSSKPGTKFSIQYGSGSVDGNLATDTLAFAGLTIKNQVFGLAEQIADVFEYQPFDGIMGLGWPSLAVDNVVPPMQNLLPQLASPIFTVWLDRKVRISQGGSGGLITYGALDAKNCDATWNYVTLSSKSYWQFPITGFSIGSYSDNTKKQAISDTGTSWLGGPSTEINNIVKVINAQYNNDQGFYIVPCQGTYPDIVFTIGGQKYHIPSTEYVIDLALGNGQCAVTIFVMDMGGFGPSWILGDAFIRTYCNVYDIGQGRIGFAKAHHTSA